MRRPRPRRYALGARWYDLVSGERPVYRVGRERGIAAAQVCAGARVLDVGCGTGLNLAPLKARIGGGGRVVGVDGSAQMLDAARSRVREAGWTGIDLVRADAGTLDTALAGRDGDDDFDAVLFMYSLSIIREWRSAFALALARTRSGGRIVVVDMSWPTGRWRVFAPLAALAFVVGGVHPRRAPWRLVERHCADVRHEVVRGGHVHIVSGTVVSRTVGDRG